MAKRSLVLIPSGLASPELEILLSRAQALIDAGDEVTVATCSGKKVACSLNVFGDPLVCFACKRQVRSGLALLKGDYIHVVIPPGGDPGEFEALPRAKLPLKKFKRDGIDIGQAVYSSYLGLTRDQDLEGRLSRFSLKKLYALSRGILDLMVRLHGQARLDRVVTYNGRQNQSRPALRFAQKHGFKAEVWEFHGFSPDRAFRFDDTLPQDIRAVGAKMDQVWAEHADQADDCAWRMYSRKRDAISISVDPVYVKNQTKGKLPDDWDPSKTNVVVFNSSEDEFAALGGEYDDTPFRSQAETCARIVEHFSKKPNSHLWIRLHPNLRGVGWTFARRLLDLAGGHANVTVVPPDSSISSYALLDHADKVVTFGSTMSVEATYWNKPSILAGRCIYEQLPGIYAAPSFEELFRLLDTPDLPAWGQEGAKKLALFWGFGSIGVPYFSGSHEHGFRFDGQAIRKSLFERWAYVAGKAIERIVLIKGLNFGFRRSRGRSVNDETSTGSLPS